VCISWSMVCTKPTNGIQQRREISWHSETLIYLKTSKERLCCLQLGQIYGIF
jgi:hypothetical protein